jgi:hypothetical protein
MTDIESDVEIECILPITGDFDVFSLLSHALKYGGHFKGHFGLTGTNKHDDLKVVVFQGR